MPAGVATSALAPVRLPMSARASGEVIEIVPFLASASGSPTICHTFCSPMVNQCNSGRYIAAGGLKQSAPCVADRIAEGAHAKAWMALAVSKTGDPNLVIW
jgi:hypothetical protein